MQITIKNPQELGLAIRATRRTQKVRLDDLSGSAGVGHVFTREVEHGKETVQLGRVMQLLEELGIKLLVDVPDEAMTELNRLRETGLRPLKPRASRAPTQDGSK
jgi:hypothetical protein